MNTPRTVLSGLLIATALLGATACEPLGEYTVEREHAAYQQEITHIEFELGAGDVHVSTRPESVIDVSRRLRWRSSRPTITEKVVGTTLRIKVDCARGCSVDYDVKAPTAVVIDARTDAGDITVDGEFGELRAETSAGDVSASALNAPDITVKTSAGDIKLGFATAPTTVDVRSGAGDVTVSVPEVDGGYQVNAGSNVGDRTVGVDSSPDSTRSLKAYTAAGDLTVRYA